MNDETNSKYSQLSSLTFGMAVFVMIFALFLLNLIGKDAETIYGVVKDCDFPGSRGGRITPRATVSLENGDLVQVFVEARFCGDGTKIRIRKERGSLFLNTRYVPADA
jgi:hypothetical protein